MTHKTPHSKSEIELDADRWRIFIKHSFFEPCGFNDLNKEFWSVKVKIPCSWGEGRETWGTFVEAIDQAVRADKGGEDGQRQI